MGTLYLLKCRFTLSNKVCGQGLLSILQNDTHTRARIKMFNKIQQDLTRSPSTEHLRWQQTRTLLAYREFTHTLLIVSCPYSKCNPTFTIYLSILFLNILTLLACTQSFHTLMVLWENEYFLTSNLLCSFTSVKLCPLFSVILRKKY